MHEPIALGDWATFWDLVCDLDRRRTGLRYTPCRDWQDRLEGYATLREALAQETSRSAYQTQAARWWLYDKYLLEAPGRGALNESEIELVLERIAKKLDVQR